MIKTLHLEDLEGILEVERKSFIPPIQASPEKIRSRLQKGHVYLGAEVDGHLIGTLAFRYSQFNPNKLESFPKSFEEFADSSNEPNPNSIFCYSFGIIPEARGKKETMEIINEAIVCATVKNLDYAVADGRCSSYNGSLEFKQEQVKQNLNIKKTIDECIASKRTPSEEQLLQDLTLAFYLKFAKGKVWKLIPNFIPEDKPSGGHRVILYRELK